MPPVWILIAIPLRLEVCSPVSARRHPPRKAFLATPARSISTGFSLSTFVIMETLRPGQKVQFTESQIL